VHPAVLVTVTPSCEDETVFSDKPSGADNQQERPLAAEWVVGFVDGEGCFSVPIFKNQTCRLGWLCQPEFAVVQGIRSVVVLHALRRFFRCGAVTVNRRTDNHRQDMGRFGVRRLSELSGCIVPFFEEHPLLTAKQDDFLRFSTVVGLMRQLVHLRMEGLELIADIAGTMNRRRPSQLAESSEATRRPSDLDGSDEDMVLAPRRRGD
jgi:hypothetical protein